MSQPKRDGIGNILLVAVSVCLVCSILVSGAAVALKPVQKAKKARRRKETARLVRPKPMSQRKKNSPRLAA